MKISLITSTIALAAISIATLTSSGGNHIDSQWLETEKSAIYEPYINNANSSGIFINSSNSSFLLNGEEIEKSSVLIENISNEVFGEMRYLNPEENARKLNMYRSMSTAVAGASFFD